ncbi:MAG: SDR family oxidoreductase [Spirulina sp. SIO3F2]|nr:SDR family oxidoreductase [Spirulina sp. SIO3F2]
MTATMTGKIAVVTGGSSGIGQAACLRFAQAGATVVLAARRAKEGEETAQMIRESGGQAVFVQTDVANSTDVTTLFKTCLERYGRLDYACNNAGIEGTIVPLAEYSEADWDQVIAVNLKGVWLCLKEEIQIMRQQGGGAIVNVSSVGGLIGFPGLGPYIATKHALLGLTKTAVLEYTTDNIRINAVCPGLIDTDLADRFTGGAESEAEQFLMSLKPMGRRGTSAEVAEAIVWLCSDAASYVTGHSMVIDGGLMTI